MSNDNPKKSFRDVAKMSGKQYAEEFDESVTKENLSELDRKIYRMALEYRGQTKKEPLYSENRFHCSDYFYSLGWCFYLTNTLYTYR